jgi:hypothetical protein
MPRRKERTTPQPKEAAPARERPTETHIQSPTAVAAETLSRGTSLPRVREETEIPHQDDVLRAGDPDVSALTNALVGDEVPGGDMPTPDQDSVDAIGRAMGVEEEDAAGPLRTSSEVLDERDKRRAFQEQLDPATRGRYRRP